MLLGVLFKNISLPKIIKVLFYVFQNLSCLCLPKSVVHQQLKKGQVIFFPHRDIHLALSHFFEMKIFPHRSTAPPLYHIKLYIYSWGCSDIAVLFHWFIYLSQYFRNYSCFIIKHIYLIREYPLHFQTSISLPMFT